MGQKNYPNEIISKHNAKDNKGNTAEMLSWSDHKDRWKGGGKTEKEKGRWSTWGFCKLTV